MKNNPLSLETVQQEIIRRLRETEQQETDLGQLHQALAKVFPQFHVKDYGYTNFSSLVREIPGMVIKSTGKNGCVKRVRYQETAISPPYRKYTNQKKDGYAAYAWKKKAQR